MFSLFLNVMYCNHCNKSNKLYYKKEGYSLPNFILTWELPIISPFNNFKLTQNIQFNSIWVNNWKLPIWREVSALWVSINAMKKSVWHYGGAYIENVPNIIHSLRSLCYYSLIQIFNMANIFIARIFYSVSMRLIVNGGHWLKAY